MLRYAGNPPRKQGKTGLDSFLADASGYQKHHVSDKIATSKSVSEGIA